ncbi:MAG TPA: 16S rRNA (cytosine(1402)-N(4))-methyltransferase RsmH [Candidatus Babeliales bacterium]|nr:16S rRNA (cytosine(1402)-N(4))-methyltransferase RsmH [Candidatus Babeliales bacterium]
MPDTLPVKPPHKSVLVNEVLHYLDPKPGKIYVDATFGAGGHTRAILEKEPKCKVIALDWDHDVLETFGASMEEEFNGRLTVVWGNFGHLIKLLKKVNVKKIDGILADFGTSQMQLAGKAGFSFQYDSPLDMRMSPAHQPMTAEDLIRTASFEKLCEIFWQLGGEGRAKQIAKAIIEERKKKPITTTAQLAAIVERAVPEKRHHRIHPATKVFQALRIYINRELDHIHSFLAATVQVVNPGGNIVCISFHSLEDSLVKQFFKDKEHLGLLTIVTPKGVAATAQELTENPSARSARLRAAQMNANSI